MSSVWRVLLVAGSIPALLAPLAPGILHSLTPAFPGKWAVTLCLTLALGDKIWAMFLRMPGRVCSPARGDWTAVAVLYANLGAVYPAIFDFYLRLQYVFWPLAGWSAAAYLAAVGLRYWALHSLAGQWNVHVDDMRGRRSLVTTGPYGLVRHPLYLAACVEVVALCAALASLPGLVTAVFVFVPLEARRARFEERYLRSLFGAAYEEYAAATAAFLPLGRVIRSTT